MTNEYSNLGRVLLKILSGLWSGPNMLAWAWVSVCYICLCMMWRDASCYWSHISLGWPRYSLSAYLCISVHLLIFSSEVWPPRLLLPGSEGNAPLIMGTCPPNSSRHLTSKQTFVGCRVIGAPASRCKLDTSLVGTNIASPEGIGKCPDTNYSSTQTRSDSLSVTTWQETPGHESRDLLEE